MDTLRGAAPSTRAVQNFSKFGDKPALVDGVDGRTITYRDLYHRIGCAAKGMAEKGIADGDVVNIHLPNMPVWRPFIFSCASLRWVRGQGGWASTVVHCPARTVAPCRSTLSPSKASRRWAQ
ncbi:hypothetical protein EON66_01630 [archaeon]|nr:MAG: hypothetical protein EON66_01630 [archaeon]